MTDERETLAGLLREMRRLTMQWETCPVWIRRDLQRAIDLAEQEARQVETLARALDSVDSDLADTIEFRHEGKQMATSFFEESRERIREALSSLPKGAMKGDGA